jgi:hypothetical protein
MAIKKDMTVQPSEPLAVDAFMAQLKHPLVDVLTALREVILQADSSIGEQIKWNAPTFFYTGELAPFNPKEYKRILIVSNFYRKDCIRLVFWRGSVGDDASGFLEGDYADGRRLATFTSVRDVQAKSSLLKRVLKAQIEHIKATG